TGTWTTYTTPLNSPNAAIPDNNTTGVSDTITVSGSGITKIEFVQVEIAATHTYQGDLELTLTSPSGTNSVLMEKHICLNAVPALVVCSNTLLAAGFKFGTVRHINEAAVGTWTLTVKDLLAVDTGTLVSWRLIFYGR
ncbi:MAG: proprotein convertase P-domain-containing protein, partial [SAR324 cluster bacterium]|nr:proprotein convertase P-domain-containing protein [SAR324 cluster bacterium]